MEAAKSCLQSGNRVPVLMNGKLKIEDEECKIYCHPEPAEGGLEK